MPAPKRTDADFIRKQKFVTSEPKSGAYTELYAGLSPDITEKDNGGWGEPEAVPTFKKESLLTSDQLLQCRRSAK
jgi:hypothetical protein